MATDRADRGQRTSLDGQDAPASPERGLLTRAAAPVDELDFGTAPVDELDFGTTPETPERCLVCGREHLRAWSVADEWPPPFLPAPPLDHPTPYLARAEKAAHDEAVVELMGVLDDVRLERRDLEQDQVQQLVPVACAVQAIRPTREQLPAIVSWLDAMVPRGSGSTSLPPKPDPWESWDWEKREGTVWPTLDDLIDDVRLRLRKTGGRRMTKTLFLKGAFASPDTLDRALDRFGVGATNWDHVLRYVRYHPKPGRP